MEGIVSSDHPDDVAPLLRGEVNLRVLNIGRVPRVVEVLLRSPGAAGIGPIRDIMGRVSREDPIDKEGVPTCVLVGDIEASFRGARGGGRLLGKLVVEYCVPAAGRVRCVARGWARSESSSNNLSLLIVDGRCCVGVWINERCRRLRTHLLPWDAERGVRGGHLE